jgi:hypothetical protein
MIPRKTGSESSARLASLASRAMTNPASLTLAEIRELGGSVLGQREPPTIPIRPDRPAFPNLLAPNPFRRKR